MGKPNKERARAGYIFTYRNAAMAAIRKEQQIIRQEAISKICMRNQSILNCATPSFMFENKWYAPYALPSPTEMDGWNRILHPSLLETVRGVIHNVTFSQREEEAVLENFFTNVLTETIHVQDLEKLIPNVFMASLPMVDPEIFNLSELPLPEEQIKILQDNNNKGISCLNEIAVRNLLLQKV
jgi:hypothetical protein